MNQAQETLLKKIMAVFPKTKVEEGYPTIVGNLTDNEADPFDVTFLCDGEFTIDTSSNAYIALTVGILADLKEDAETALGFYQAWDQLEN